MPLLKDWGFCGPSNPETSALFDPQYSINLYPVPGGPHSKSRMALYGRPGLSPTPFSTIAAPVRTLWAGSNRLFAVGGANVYELKNDGTVLTTYGAMAGATGDAYLIANGTQLLACDPASGNIYNVINPGFASVFGGVALEYLDGFYIAIASAAQCVTSQGIANANPNQINVSALGDGTTWPALNYVIRSGAADLCTQLAVLGGYLWIFGQKAIEVWYNAGNPLFPFARVTGATINLGLLAPATVVKFDNTVMWLGSDDRGYAIVYRSNGLQPQRVSNSGMEAYFGYVGTQTLAAAIAYGYQENGHTFYVLNTIGGQSVYDLSTGLWHLRTYTYGAPQCACSLPNFSATGPLYVGDNHGKIWFQSLQYPNDGTGNAITYQRVAPPISEGNRWLRFPSLEIDADIGAAQMKLSYSDNGSQSYKTLARPDAIIAASNEQTGAAGRYIWRQLGRSRDRRYVITIVDSTNLIRIIDAYADVRPGNEAETHK